MNELIREKNIELATTDPVVRGGFTQVPNFILRNPELSAGAKVVYAMFLSYVWNNDFCFPGQERLAQDLGMSRSRVTEFVSELSRSGLVTIQRRGQGKVNFYIVNSRVKGTVRRPRRADVGPPTSRSRPLDHQLSAR